MKRVLMIGVCLLAAVAVGVAANESERGLVAHYFADKVAWDGNWPEEVSVPRVSPADWTFTEYKYSRVEPVINHLFVNKGWFSVRWTGYIDPSAADGQDPTVHAITGEININPNNSEQNEFVLTLADGSTVTKDMLKKNYAGYEGAARYIHVKPKGNGSQNKLIVDGEPFDLVNADTYDITSSSMTVKLYNDNVNKNGKPIGNWWITVTAMEATLVCTKDGGGAAAAGGQSKKAGAAKNEYIFEIWADDGCRLFIDDKALIDDWRAAWDMAPDSLRKAAPVELTAGKHKIVVEYFQGQSLKDGDKDPIKLYWSCPAAGIPRQTVPVSCLSHGPENMKSSSR